MGFDLHIASVLVIGAATSATATLLLAGTARRPDGGFALHAGAFSGLVAVASLLYAGRDILHPLLVIGAANVLARRASSSGWSWWPPRRRGRGS